MSRAARTAQSHADAWDVVYNRLTAADPKALSVTELEALAEAAFWLGKPRESIAARQRAYAVYRDAGDVTHAARTAWLLFHNYFDLDETAAASGWLQRAHRQQRRSPTRSSPDTSPWPTALGRTTRGSSTVP